MRHWHRRLDMLQDKESADDDGRDGPDDGAKDEGKDGKFEYVTGNDKGSSQVQDPSTSRTENHERPLSSSSQPRIFSRDRVCSSPRM